MDKVINQTRFYRSETESFDALYALTMVFATGMVLLLLPFKVPSQFTSSTIGALLGIALNYYPDFREYAKLVWHAKTLEILYFPLLLLRLLSTIDMQLFLKSLHQIMLISLATTLLPGITVAYVVLIMTKMQVKLNSVLLISLLFSLNALPQAIAIANPVKNFEVLLYGEAVFIMVWAMPMFTISNMAELGLATSLIQVVFLVIRSLLLSVCIGCLVGLSVAQLIKYVYFDLHNTLAVTISVSFFTYCLCQLEAGCNGPLATTVALICMFKEKSIFSIDRTKEFLSIIRLLHIIISNAITAGLVAIVLAHALENLHKRDVGTGFVAYVLLNVMRAVTYFILASILSRIGYGLNVHSLCGLFIGMTKGPAQLILLIKFQNNSEHESLLRSLHTYLVMLLLLMGLVNGLIGNIVLKASGILKLSKLHQNNISIAIKNILESRFTMLSMVKMNRFFSDANWPTIYAFTDIKDPHLELDEKLSDFTYFDAGIRKAQCPSCYKTISIDPTATEYVEMAKEVRLRVLKMMRVSFMRQFEQGIINTNELMGLLQAVEVAFDSNEKEINIDEFIEKSLSTPFSKQLKRSLLRFQVIKTEIQPKTKYSKYWYKKSRSSKCLIPMYLIDIAYIVLAIVVLVEAIMNVYLYFVFVVFYAVFTAKEVVVIFGLSIESINQGVRHYFRNFWNILDFLVLLVHYTEIVLMAIFYFLELQRAIEVCQYTRFLRILVLIKLILFCEKLFPKYLTCLDNMADLRICYSFIVGKGLIVSYDEILNILPTICDNSSITREIKECVVSKKLKIMETLAIIQKERPWISVTAETKQALGATLKGMHDSLNELKLAGYIDKHEFILISSVLKEQQKAVITYKSVNALLPKSIFFEVGYLCDDRVTLEYIYDKITMKVWKTGDVICEIGDVIPGVYIIVSGVIKMTYIPQAKYLKRLKNHGALPIKNILSNFNEEQVDYFMIGNTIGELSILTNRESSCTYEAFMPCQAFIIPANILKEAFKKSNDPVNGLRSRMWRYVVTELAKKVLLTTYAYNSLSQLSLNLERAIVPDLRRFKTLVLSDLVENVILVDGILTDYVTRDVYVAPCYVPRTVQCMILTDPSVPDSVPTKLMILPMKDVDEYDVMMKAEMESVMMTSSEISMVGPLSQFIQEMNIKRHFSLMMLKKSMGTKIFTNKSQALGIPKMI